MMEFFFRKFCYYFVTMCTKDRAEIFGFADDQHIYLNGFGRAVPHCWFDLPQHYSCTLDAFVVMPNHIHGIIVIPDEPIPNPVAGGLNPQLRGVVKTTQHPLT